MTKNKKDLTVIPVELKKKKPGVKNQNAKGMDGFRVSFLPVSEFIINPDDYNKPGKLYMSSSNNVRAPVQSGSPAVTKDSAKRYEELENPCTFLPFSATGQFKVAWILKSFSNSTCSSS